MTRGARSWRGVKGIAEGNFGTPARGGLRAGLVAAVVAGALLAQGCTGEPGRVTDSAQTPSPVRPSTSPAVAPEPTVSASPEAPAPLVLGEGSSDGITYPVVTQGPFAHSTNDLIASVVAQIADEIRDADEHSCGYSVLLNQAGLLSLEFRGTYFYEGTAHPTNFVRLASFDVAAGTRLVLSDRIAIDDRFVAAVRAAVAAEFQDFDVDDVPNIMPTTLEIQERAQAADREMSALKLRMESAVVPGGIQVTVPFIHALGGEHALELRDGDLTLLQPRATGPHYRTQLVTRAFTTDVGTYTYRYTKPVVTGVAASIAESIDSQAVTFFESAIAARTAADLECEPDYDPYDPLYGSPFSPSGSSVGGLYGDRYLSVFLDWEATGCSGYMGLGDSTWLNIDLATGAEVSLGTFVRPGDDAFAYAVGIAIAERDVDDSCWSGASSCRKRWAEGCADTRWPDVSSWQRPDGWVVSELGVAVYFLWPDMLESYLVPWKSINVAADALTTATARDVPARMGARVTVVQQGHLVTVESGKTRWRGIRPIGSDTAKLFLIGEDEHGPTYAPGYSVRFASATSSEPIEADVRPRR